MSKVLIVFSLLGLLSACVGQIVQSGQCNPDQELATNFDIDEFLGTWYEIGRTDNPNQPGDCSYFELTRNDDTINVYHSSVAYNFFEEANGTASHEVGTAKLILNITSFENPIDFWVRFVNPLNTALTYACENISLTERRVYLWVLGRETTFPNELTQALINTTITSTFGIDPASLRYLDHSDDACYILPVIEPNQPIILPGQCDPNLPVVQNFLVGNFTGVWHQIASYETENSNGACARAEYSVGDGVVDVLNSQVIDQTLLTIDGYASVSSTDGSAKLSVVLNIAPGVQQSQDLWVLATDYENYAISYTCLNVTATEKRVYSWILSRTRQMPANVQTEVDQVVNSIIDLNYAYYIQTNQSDAGCFFYPEPVPNQPVVFRGQCSSVDVDAMANFDAVRYMGLWHNIELYPAPFQGGNCSNAEYDLVEGGVSVFNTQVINQTLDTINAFAVVASTDGTAKLLVTFPVAGTNLTVTTDYWVLDTDYDNYAVVYSCFNLNADEMQVGSWKLSRTKQLAPASVTAINNVINSVSVLDQMYFEPMDQSVDSCFYFPEPEAGVPVVFPGQCDENIAVVQGFSFTQFQGVWHEIQAYPKVQETGQCINHAYTFVSDTQLNLVSSSVDDQFLVTSNGTLGYSSNVNNGNLTITITDVNGTAINIPFLILSTDYNNYALAYSCVNIGEDFRGVWSWKLSRTRQLSEAANTAINNVIANNVVLGNEYYEDIDQSDRACFFLPDLLPGEPIILTGQCDSSVTALPNFNIAEYLGRWRLVESYGSEFQVGTCNVAQYSLGADNIFNVVNSEVVDQELRTISGSFTTDGTGNLVINFPSSQQSFQLQILDTDYESYALGYSCVNLVNNERRVYSWKFSRNNILSQTAIDNMNRIINEIEVLNNRFYYNVNRTDAGCFYFPTPNINSTVRFRGQCDENIPVVTNFDAGSYLGLWHDIESYPEDFQDGTCINAYYSPGNDVDVYNTQVINQRLFSISGSASLVPSTDGSAKLEVIFEIGGFNATTNYWVLATDYNSYSFVYSCKPIDDEYVQVSSWKLSRTKSLTPAAITAINAVIDTIPVLDQRYYRERDQSPEGCFYYPEPEPNVPVVFPGQCDDNIAAVPAFNMAQFGGEWFEIEAYPKEEQPGQCINHQFTLSGNTLDMQSSNVFNLTLGLTTGNVRMNSTDGSGRLAITFTSDNGTVIEIPYWILSTDYNDYALAYSCVNINSDFRGIWSWKLSRTKQLSAAANTTINNAISNIVVLGNEYYEPIDQSDQACFYLPDLLPGAPVILPGQCNSSVTAIPNFNITRYEGRWNLVESYGSDLQVGTCNVARYTLEANNALGVVNSQVEDQELRIISGTANISSTDGTGKLMFYYPSRDEYSDFYILDTDYDSYAFGYNCINLENNQRRVYSWKLSRQNTLSQVATDNINRIIDSIDVLTNQYYYSINRTEAGCFYFPTPDNFTPVRFRGRCDPDIPVVTNFDAGAYLGLWHDIESYPVNFQYGTCNNAYYSPGNDVDVFNTQVINQTLDVISGSASLVPSTDGSAKLDVTFNIAGSDETTSYWVLATDYNSYALVYSCENFDDEYVQVVTWKLSRTKALTPAATTAINAVMDTIPVLDQRYFVARDQSPEGCFYYPEPQPNVPVVFPGQCDDDIAAVAGFNMAQFEGLWHEIEAYPKEEQPGQCINHRFTLEGNTLSMQSSNVFAQSLGLTNGNVRFNTTDGTGRLAITFTADNGTVIEIPYWILSTDYTDYALAYSCVNINSDYRGVWSWKLSRTKQLSAAANTQINNAIANINVLGNEYYETIQQSDDACFYFPELGPTDPVIFPGQCDANIPVMQNFDAGRYLGRWRLIETYYSDFQEGSCNEANYSGADDGSVIVYNTEVLNEELLSMTGSAVLATTDGSAKLIVTFPNAPPLDYWILDTDYDSYALVYTCVNITSDQRRVFSWKMSRDNTLSVAATNIINQVVNTVDVLDDRYYQTVNRSDAACFYFPTPGENVVVFRGQCDETIPAVAGFNPVAYEGRWYDVESYPTPFQPGTCNTANYTLTPDEEYDVLVVNTEVVDQVLQTMIGSAVIASTDGTAKLNVTFPSSNGDVTTNYWVLSTDYTTYSLVYSCQNLDEETRAVYSWKLGRDPSLPPAAVTAINNAMNTVQVIDQRYFALRDHTEDGCFYYPEQNGIEVILNGQCVPDAAVPAVTNFNANLFAGTWNEVARFPSTLQNGECAATQYSLSSANVFGVTQTSVIDEQLLTTTAQATVTNGGRGVISATINGVPFNDVYILATDYTEYALAYSCRNINETAKQVYSWKLSRSRAGLSEAANNVIDGLVRNNIDLHGPYYRNTSQDDASCFYYPEFEQLPATIELPGPCNTTIRGIANFNAGNYLGRWFEIARYPQLDQFGQCDRAVYTDAGNTVAVENSQVVDGTLMTMLGSATVASNDGSGVLDVQFIVNGEVRNIDYYILATDYNNYALVYTCGNLANGNRRVGSWKLSRSRELSVQANTAIDSVISQVQGLNQSYYQTTSQTEEDCFYVPSMNVSQAPLFRGQCEAITGVAGFDVNRYLGWWHEIERYPSDNNVGECISSQYQTSGTTIQVVDTNVFDDTYTTVTGTITASNDGRLQRVLSDGRTQDIWVLATDYETYSLLYSCENVGDEYRRVWSAKHSKQRALTPAAQTVMAPIIESNRVLYPQFYLEVSQTDNACFHYPTQTGAEVVLPGQCDVNIPVVQNFAMDDFQGTWYQISRYDEVQDSTCIGTRYVFNSESGNIDVINFEVLAGELETTQGTGQLSSDGSGRLSITLPIADTNDTVTTTMYILATEYDDWALAYSCVNINAFQRQVGAWQLSRDRVMSTNGVTAIGALAAQRQELHLPYFKQISQNAECLEPSSAFFFKSSIIMILVCAVLQLML